MKLRKLNIAGFRGFNDERTIYFHDKLTLVAAHNSYGKTSISEALEFLLFGSTSKVEHADSKDEYRDSYRNKHFPENKPAYIEATFLDSKNEDVELRLELDATGEIRRLANGKQTEDWPFATDLLTAAKPFILQHALKYLLLVPPAERFQGFARLLGLNDIDRVHQAIVSLCTKPEASIPPQARKMIGDLESFELRLKSFPGLEKTVKGLKKNSIGLNDAFKALEARAELLLGVTTKLTAPDLLRSVVRERDEAVARVYSGTVNIKVLSESELKQVTSACEGLSSGITTAFLNDFAGISVKGITERLRREARLLDLGVELLDGVPSICPLCGQEVSDSVRAYISERQNDLKARVGKTSTSDDARRGVEVVLQNLRVTVERHERILESRSGDLLSSIEPENKAKILRLFGVENAANWETVKSAVDEITPHFRTFREAATNAIDSISACENALRQGTEELSQTEAIAKHLNDYLEAAETFESSLDVIAPKLTVPARTLQQAIDKLAGTAELTLIIEMLEGRPKIEQVLKIRTLLDGLKELKKHVDQTIGETMETAINSQLTTSVMTWYGMIRTTGDPDVHFSGFAMDRTKAGDFRSRRLKVQAQSYGVELASAVSSLSESKLNALGLCVSIASALRSPGPWQFLLLDDPIQSWDDEHETQFIDVIRTLAEREGKQIILLSHKGQWISRVRSQCLSLNGHHYEITGYAKDGPRLSAVEWSPVKQRLNEANIIANDPNSSSVRLQQAEEEVRLASCQTAAQIARKKLGCDSSPHNMNGKDIRSILTAAGCPTVLLDKVTAAFADSDVAHHAPKHYEPNAQRIRQRVGTIQELLKHFDLG